MADRDDGPRSPVTPEEAGKLLNRALSAERTDSRGLLLRLIGQGRLTAEDLPGQGPGAPTLPDDAETVILASDEAPTHVIPAGRAIYPEGSPPGAHPMETRPSSEPCDTETRERTVSLPLGDENELGTAWGRFEVVALVGKGGMGKVYKVYDPALNRHAALKVIRGDPSLEIERFLREARAQAMVHHENLCEIYETGMLETLSGDRRPYILMRFVDGLPLREAAREMTVEQKAEVMAKVADALHAAHQAGIVHRDIKPSNLLVANDPETGWKPFVMDFGIAREQGATDLTTTGMVLGTPAYMSPEQASGDIHRVDRRADVYSLGATLYEILAGKPPFEGGSAAMIFSRIVLEDPVPVRKIAPFVPVDLGTVVMKCLEKEPNRRYASAKALAEDLRRYLADEPVQARRTGLLQLLFRRARKHKGITVAACLALMAVAVLLVLLTHARWESARELEAAKLFGQKVRDMEAVMRFARLLPAHDIRGEMAVVRSLMDDVRRSMARQGRFGDGPGNYALGRGFMELLDYPSARRHLEMAWEAGYRGADTAGALGHVLGELYLAGVREARAIPDPVSRERRLARLRAEYRVPILGYLRLSSEGWASSPEQPLALMAFTEGRTEEALILAKKAFARMPWFYESKLLEGNIHIDSCLSRIAGGRYAEAEAERALGEQSFREAGRIARSDPRCIEGLCLLDVAALEAGAYRTGDPEPVFRRTLAACSETLAINPDSHTAHLCLSYLYGRRAEAATESGEDPDALLKQAIAFGLKAARIKPGDVRTNLTLSLVYTRQAVLEASRGLDPRPDVEKVLSFTRRAVEADPRDEVFAALAWNNRGSILGEYYRWQVAHGRDAEGTFEDSCRSLGVSHRLNPRNPLPCLNLGTIWMFRSQHDLARGADPRPAVEESLRWLKGVDRLGPGFPMAHSWTARAHLVTSLYLVGKGEDPSASLEQALLAVRELRRLQPDRAGVPALEAEIAICRGRWASFSGRSPGEAFGDARRFLEEAEGKSGDRVGIRAVRAELCLRQAAWRLGFGTEKGVPAEGSPPPQQDGEAARLIGEGLAAADQGASLERRSARFLWLTAALCRLWTAVLRGDARDDAQRRFQDARSRAEAFGGEPPAGLRPFLGGRP
ncbi:MAG: protein kinase [Acidobacteria bacterium]|nr:protein kinase [Acidobacteriota bacterium]